MFRYTSKSQSMHQYVEIQICFSWNEKYLSLESNTLANCLYFILLIVHNINALHKFTQAYTQDLAS